MGRLIPPGALLLAAMVWGATFALVKGALEDAEALSFLAFRFTVAVVSLGLGCVFVKRLGRLAWASPSEWAMGALTGAVLYVGFFFQTEGLRFTSTANSAFITGLCVVIVPFLMWAGGRPPRRSHVVGAGVAAAGLMLLSGADLAATGMGDALTLACAFAFAFHIVCLGVFGEKMEPVRLFSIQMASAALLAWAAALLWGGEVAWSRDVLLALAVTGIFGTAGAFFLQTWAQRRMEPSRAGLWLLTEPLFALGYGYALLGEIPSAMALAGAGVILVGVAYSEAGDMLMRTIFSRTTGMLHSGTDEDAPSDQIATTEKSSC